MNRNKLILVITLVVLCLLYLVLRLGRPEEKLSPVFAIDTLKIGTIQVFDNADTLKLEKIDKLWMLTDPVKWEADTLRINELFRKVFTAKYPRTPMGEGQDAIKRFKLQDNQALHMVVSEAKGKNPIHVLFSNMGNPYDYFRYYGSDKIYQIKTKVTNLYTTELAMWRSPHVVNHEEIDLLKIQVSFAGNSYTLTRKEYDWHYKDATNDFMIVRSNIAMMKVVHILASLDTYVFVDSGDPEIIKKFQKPECTVMLTLSKNRTQELKFVKHDDSQQLMMVDNDPSVLFMVSNDTVFRFTRPADLFKMRAYGT